MIEFEYHGPLLLRSNYWESPEAERGEPYFAPYMHCIRMLIPRRAVQETPIEDIRLSSHVIVSIGPHKDHKNDLRLEILFENRTAEPYVLYTTAQQWTMLPDPRTQWTLALYQDRRTRAHKVCEKPCYVRNVPELPWLRTVSTQEQRDAREMFKI